MNSAELEAQADKTAFPWSCILCQKTFHYAKQWRAKVAWGDVCIDCIPDEAERIEK